MSLVIHGSRHSRNSLIMIIAMCLIFGGYFLYDGWVSESFQQKHLDADTGKPDANLQFNRIYGPILCGAAALWFAASLWRWRWRRLEATDTGIVIGTDKEIPYAAMTRLDKRFFEAEGHFTLYYTVPGTSEEAAGKFSDRDYDGLGTFLDTVVSKTGAAGPGDNPDAAE